MSAFTEPNTVEALIRDLLCGPQPNVPGTGQQVLVTQNGCGPCRGRYSYRYSYDWSR